MVNYRVSDLSSFIHNIDATNRQRRFIYLFYDKCSVRSDAQSKVPQEFMHL